MPAFMIVTAKIHDRARFIAEYGAPAAALIAQFGGKYIVRAPGAVALESKLSGAGEGASVVVSQWPDKAALMAFWQSPDYQRLKAARESLADVDVIIVEQARA